MILLPIGHEASGTRRLPWITFSVMAICVVAFFVTGRASLFSEDDLELSSRVTRALEYYAEHPHLELDSDFRDTFFPDENLEDLLEDWALPGEGAAGKPADRFARKLEQDQLDVLSTRAVTSYHDHPFMSWGLVPARVEPPAVVTHMFLHAGWLHLLGNLLILYLAGPFIEDAWGRPLYAGFYLFSGWVAALLHVAASPGSTVPMVGASGAIAGVMGAFLVRYRLTRIRFFYMIGIFVRGTFAAPAWMMLPLWFVLQLVFAIQPTEDSSGVAHWAHVGGFAAGLGVALAIAGLQVERRLILPALEARVGRTLHNNAIVNEALEAKAGGDLEGSFALLVETLRRNPRNLDAAFALWDQAVDLHREVVAAPLVLRAVQSGLRSQRPTIALDLWESLLGRLPGIRAEPGLLARLSQALVAEGRLDIARVTLRKTMLAGGSAMTSTMALKIARVSRHVDEQVARAALRLALGRDDLEPGNRADAERLERDLDPALAVRAAILAPPGSGLRS